MNKQDVVFLSINTTGNRPTHDKIFAIGLCYWQDEQLIEWHKLINPETTFPLMLQKITGFTSSLLRQAHLFADVATELQTILQNKLIIVANAQLKVSFLKNAFKALDYTWRQYKVICMSKLIQHTANSLPQEIKDFANFQESYCTKINVQQLADIFAKISHYVTDEDLVSICRKLQRKLHTPNNINVDFLDTIPLMPGVYKFYNRDNNLLYIGKSICLRERVKSHFTAAGTNNKEMQLAQQTSRIDWLTTAGELGALLLEARLIKQFMPIYNRKLRRYKRLYNLALMMDENNYWRLRVIVCQQSDAEDLIDCYGLFRRKQQANEFMRTLIKQHGFCAKFMELEKTKGPCFFYQLKWCKGACVGKENIADYNARLKSVLMASLYQPWPYPGRIAIKEVCATTQLVEYHLVDQWCYLATVKDTADFKKTFMSMFDLDIYRILIHFFKKISRDEILTIT